MTSTPRTARYRDALFAAILPAPGRGLPGLAEVELEEFWRQFEASAPPHLRLGLSAASVAVGGVLPRLLGYGRGLPELTADEREAVITRAAELPGFADLVEIAKVVACLAYFSDEATQRVGRSRGAESPSTRDGGAP